MKKPLRKAGGSAATGRLCALIDLELGQLEEESRRLAMIFLHEAIERRLAAERSNLRLIRLSRS